MMNRTTAGPIEKLESGIIVQSIDLSTDWISYSIIRIESFQDVISAA